MTEWVRNPAVERIRRLAAGSGVAALALAVGALADLAVLEPRLLSPRELLPPDEGVVWAFLPALVALAAAAVLFRSVHRSAAAFRVVPGRVEWVPATVRQGTRGRALVLVSVQAVEYRTDRAELSVRTTDRTVRFVAVHPGTGTQLVADFGKLVEQSHPT